MANLRLTYSIADQNFKKTKSLGILNASIQLLTALGQHLGPRHMDILSNSTLSEHFQLIDAKGTVHLHDIAIASNFRRILWDQYLVYRAAKKLGNSWLFLPKGFSSFIHSCPVRLCLLAHDAMIDYYEQHFPSAMPRLESYYFKRCIKANFRHAQIIFCSSQFTLSEMERLSRKWGCPQPKMVPLGLGVIPKLPSWAHQRSGIIVLASGYPHKRTDLAVRFLDQWQLETQSKDVVHWVGRFPKGLSMPTTHSNWQFHERIDETDYRRLMATVKKLVYFSDYEGYGLPPIEAVMVGACPVYSDIPVSREVMLGLGCTFQNSAYDSFLHAMKNADQVTMGDLDGWAMQLEQKHSWAMVAQRFVDALSAYDQTPA